MTTVSRIPVSIRTLARCLRSYRVDARECEDGMDVRLRVHNGSWQVLTGLSDYDQDHRGFWGCSGIPQTGRVDLTAMARDLISQVRDHMAGC